MELAKSPIQLAFKDEEERKAKIAQLIATARTLQLKQIQRTIQVAGGSLSVERLNNMRLGELIEMLATNGVQIVAILVAMDLDLDEH